MFKLLLLATGIATLAACASDPIETSGDARSLPAFSTFQVHDEQYVFAEPLTEDKRARISTELRLAAVEALKARGYRESTPGDVLVVLGAVTHATAPEVEKQLQRGINAVDTSALDTSRPDLPMPRREDSAPVVGSEGDLILYLLDAKNQRTLWRASSSGTASSPAEAMGKARATFRAMAERLPPATGAKP
jgi:hypothetical protein